LSTGRGRLVEHRLDDRLEDRLVEHRFEDRLVEHRLDDRLEDRLVEHRSRIGWLSTGSTTGSRTAG
jgi:hypothetical protein